MIKLIAGAAMALLTTVAFWPTSAWAADAAAGKAVYAKKCQVCHGASGQGNPGMAKALKVEMKSLGSAEVQGKSDADIKKIITEGMGKMRPISGLSSGDIDNVIAFVRTLKQ
jgi:mono/diheme cytochrome c family protein